MRRWVNWLSPDRPHEPGPQELVLLADDIFGRRPAHRPEGFETVRAWHVHLLEAMAAARWPQGAPKVHQPIFVVPTRFPMIVRNAIESYQPGGVEQAENIVLASHVELPRGLTDWMYFESLLWPRRALYIEPRADLDLGFVLRSDPAPEWILVRDVYGLPGFDVMWARWYATATAAGVPIERLHPELAPGAAVGTRPAWAR